MPADEISVPKEIREFLPDNAKETILGHKNGASRQYRYGNLHIREYDNEFLVHADKVDPGKDAIGHLIHDAPEVLAGLACAALGGALVGKKKSSVKWAMAASAAAGYLGYAAARRLKDRAGK